MCTCRKRPVPPNRQPGAEWPQPAGINPVAAGFWLRWFLPRRRGQRARLSGCADSRSENDRRQFKKRLHNVGQDR